MWIILLEIVDGSCDVSLVGTVCFPKCTVPGLFHPLNPPSPTLLLSAKSICSMDLDKLALNFRAGEVFCI